MLKFFTKYADDETADRIVKGFINDQMMEFIEGVTGIFAVDDGFMVSDDFIDYIEGWFPDADYLDEEKMTITMLNLCKKLISVEEEELTTMEKFVAFNIMKEIHDMEEDLMESGFQIVQMPSVYYLYGVIKDEGIDDEAECTPGEILIMWRDFLDATDYLFEDKDFLYLNFITEDMVKDLSKMM